ncbi:hypothetical protein LINGRAHAP2_LOCUS7505 [Linum grandiflorum]
MRFPLTEYMRLKDTDVDTAYYIFADGLPADEVLVDTDMCFCERKTLWSLLPGKCLATSIITCLATTLNHQYPLELCLPAVDCFLPANLQTMVMKHGLTPEKAYHYYGNNFLLQAQKATKVFLPMIDEDTHCYLAVILMENNEVDMVDSLPRTDRLNIRQSDIRTMMKFMSRVFQIMYAYWKIDGEVPNIADFKITIPPDVPRQPNMYDCGMWVCSWMMQAIEGMENIYSIEFHSNLDRLKLAVLLVKGRSNLVMDAIKKKVEGHASVRRRAIRDFLDGNETAGAEMKYTDTEGARRKLIYGD